MASTGSVGSCNIVQTPVTRPTETPAPVATPQPAAQNVSTGAVKDKVDVKDAKPANTTEVKADAWKKGKNDCMEHMLLNSGYDLKEIYTKGKDGKTLAQRVAADNGLKDPNLIRTGQKLNIPKKGDSESASSEGLKKGETAQARVENGDRSATKTAEHTEDGKEMRTKVENGGASVEQTTHVGEKGRIDGSVSKKGDTVRATEVAKNGNGDAITQSTTTAGPNGTRTVITDRDATPNMHVKVDGSGIVTENPGVKDPKDVVRTETRDNKGVFETIGSWGDNLGNWLVGHDRSTQDLDVNNARKVVEQRNADGSRQVSVTGADGKVQTHTREADGLGQQAGRWYDQTLTDFGSWVSKQFN